MTRSRSVQRRSGIVAGMKNRTLLILVIAVVLIAAVAVRARGGKGEFMHRLGTMIHGTPGH